MLSFRLRWWNWSWFREIYNVLLLWSGCLWTRRGAFWSFLVPLSHHNIAESHLQWRLETFLESLLWKVAPEAPRGRTWFRSSGLLSLDWTSNGRFRADIEFILHSLGVVLYLDDNLLHSVVGLSLNLRNLANWFHFGSFILLGLSLSCRRQFRGTTSPPHLRLDWWPVKSRLYVFDVRGLMLLLDPLAFGGPSFLKSKLLIRAERLVLHRCLLVVILSIFVRYGPTYSN